MSPRSPEGPARSSAPKLGVARGRRVRTAGGRVGQWWTPPWLADELVRWAGLDEPIGRRPWRVLDAGAGMGALSLAALERAHVDVTLVERDERLVAKLEVLVEGFPDRARVRAGDFLVRDVRQAELFDAELLRGFDVVLMNPPWEGDLPERFILRGLELAERVCAIVPLNMQCGGARSRFWGHVGLQRVRALPHRPRFLASKGGMRDVMLIEVADRPPSGRHAALEVG